MTSVAARELPTTSAAPVSLAGADTRSHVAMARGLASELEGRRRTITLGGSLLLIPASAGATLAVDCDPNAPALGGSSESPSSGLMRRSGMPSSLKRSSQSLRLPPLVWPNVSTCGTLAAAAWRMAARART